MIHQFLKYFRFWDGKQREVQKDVKEVRTNKERATLQNQAVLELLFTFPKAAVAWKPERIVSYITDRIFQEP